MPTPIETLRAAAANYHTQLYDALAKAPPQVEDGSFEQRQAFNKWQKGFNEQFSKARAQLNNLTVQAKRQDPKLADGMEGLDPEGKIYEYLHAQEAISLKGTTSYDATDASNYKNNQVILAQNYATPADKIASIQQASVKTAAPETKPAAPEPAAPEFLHGPAVLAMAADPGATAATMASRLPAAWMVEASATLGDNKNPSQTNKFLDAVQIMRRQGNLNSEQVQEIASHVPDPELRRANRLPEPGKAAPAAAPDTAVTAYDMTLSRIKAMAANGYQAQGTGLSDVLRTADSKAMGVLTSGPNYPATLVEVMRNASPAEQKNIFKALMENPAIPPATMEDLSTRIGERVTGFDMHAATTEIQQHPTSDAAARAVEAKRSSNSVRYGEKAAPLSAADPHAPHNTNLDIHAPGLEGGKTVSNSFGQAPAKVTTGAGHTATIQPTPIELSSTAHFTGTDTPHQPIGFQVPGVSQASGLSKPAATQQSIGFKPGATTSIPTPSTMESIGFKPAGPSPLPATPHPAEPIGFKPAQKMGTPSQAGETSPARPIGFEIPSQPNPKPATPTTPPAAPPVEIHPTVESPVKAGGGGSAAYNMLFLFQNAQAYIDNPNAKNAALSATGMSTVLAPLLHEAGGSSVVQMIPTLVNAGFDVADGNYKQAAKTTAIGTVGTTVSIVASTAGASVPVVAVAAKIATKVTVAAADNIDHLTSDNKTVQALGKQEVILNSSTVASYAVAPNGNGRVAGLVTSTAGEVISDMGSLATSIGSFEQKMGKDFSDAISTEGAKHGPIVNAIAGGVANTIEVGYKVQGTVATLAGKAAGFVGQGVSWLGNKITTQANATNDGFSQVAPARAELEKKIDAAQAPKAGSPDTAQKTTPPAKTTPPSVSTWMTPAHTPTITADHPAATAASAAVHPLVKAMQPTKAMPAAHPVTKTATAQDDHHTITPPPPTLKVTSAIHLAR